MPRQSVFDTQYAAPRAAYVMAHRATVALEAAVEFVPDEDAHRIIAQIARAAGEFGDKGIRDREVKIAEEMLLDCQTLREARYGLSDTVYVEAPE